MRIQCPEDSCRGGSVIDTAYGALGLRETAPTCLLFRPMRYASLLRPTALGGIRLAIPPVRSASVSDRGGVTHVAYSAGQIGVGFVDLTSSVRLSTPSL